MPTTAASASILVLSGTPRVVGQTALAIFTIVGVALGCVRLNADAPSLTLAERL